MEPKIVAFISESFKALSSLDTRDSGKSKELLLHLEEDAISLARVLARDPEDVEAREALEKLIPERKVFITATITAESGASAAATWDTILTVAGKLIPIALVLI